MKEIDVSKGAVKTPSIATKQPLLQSAPTRIKRESLITKIIAIVKTDIHNLISPNKIRDEDWENYKRFCEMAKQK